ncbi:MAG: hypothetical protein N4A64_00355 [Marinisporobacter sp.]|jgi:hypothetical protein|nr:hypothetical protein [Marinisporobacter sp.]
MMNYSEEKYTNTFESIYADLQNQREKDPRYTIYDLENLLESLYANEGNNWTGRGENKDVTTAATISACETFLTEWRSESSKNV